MNPKTRDFHNYETISGGLGRGKERQRTSSASAGKRKHNSSFTYEKEKQARASDVTSQSVMEPEIRLGQDIPLAKSIAKVSAPIGGRVLRQRLAQWHESKPTKAFPRKGVTAAAVNRAPQPAGLGTAANKQISFLFLKKPGTGKKEGRLTIQQQDKKNIFNFNIHT